jgi:hypothetical protein
MREAPDESETTNDDFKKRPAVALRGWAVTCYYWTIKSDEYAQGGALTATAAAGCDATVHLRRSASIIPFFFFDGTTRRLGDSSIVSSLEPMTLVLQPPPLPLLHAWIYGSTPRGRDVPARDGRVMRSVAKMSNRS